MLSRSLPPPHPAPRNGTHVIKLPTDGGHHHPTAFGRRRQRATGCPLRWQISLSRERADRMNPIASSRVPIEYINPEVPAVEVPPYLGRREEAFVPDTLDLQERAALAVNGLTGPTDPAADYELYWLVSFGG